MLRKVQKLLSLPMVAGEFLRREVGAPYGITMRDKMKLLREMRDNTTKIESASDFFEHIALATAALRIPPDLDGCLVECGTYKGSSAATLSLVARLCGRRLEIFDSFEGLPEPTERDRAHRVVASQQLHTYERGAFCGPLEEVRDNLTRYGAVDVCSFREGYFHETLPEFDQPVVFAFTDVDLVDSLEPCLRYLWPKLQDGCPFYTHEASHMEIAGLFFDRAWWDRELGVAPPGLIGSGSGLGLGPVNAPYFGSQLGYAVKNAERVGYIEVPQAG